MTANSVHVPTVVIDRQYYDEEMQKTLTEESTYQPVEKDSTPQFERKMNAQVMSLKRSALSTPKWHSWEAQQSGFHYYMVHPRCNTDRMPRSMCPSWLSGLQGATQTGCLALSIVSFMTLRPTRCPSIWLQSSLAPLVEQPAPNVLGNSEHGTWSQVHQGASVVRGWDQNVLWCVVFFTCFPSGLTVKVAQWGLKDYPSLLERTYQSVEDVVGLLTLCLDAIYRQRVDDGKPEHLWQWPTAMVITEIIEQITQLVVQWSGLQLF